MINFCFFRSDFVNSINPQNFIITNSNELSLHFAICVESLVYRISYKGRGSIQIFFLERFQKTKTSLIKFIPNKVGSCYFTKYKFHCSYLMSTFSRVLILGCSKNFLFFHQILYLMNPRAYF